MKVIPIVAHSGRRHTRPRVRVEYTQAEQDLLVKHLTPIAPADRHSTVLFERIRKAVPELRGHSYKSLYQHYKRNATTYDGWCAEAAAKEAAKGTRVNPRESIYNYAPTSPPAEYCIINGDDAPFLIALGLQRLADTHGVDLAEATRVWSFSNRDFRTADCVFIGRGIKDEDLRDDSDPEVMHEELMYLDSGEEPEWEDGESDDGMDEDDIGDGIGVTVQVAARGGNAVEKTSSNSDSDEEMPVVGVENSSSDADDEESETGDVDYAEALVEDLDTTSRVLAWRKLQLAHENDDKAQTGDGDAPIPTPNVPLPSPALATASAVADLDMVPTDTETEAADPPQPTLPPLRPNGTRRWGSRVRTMAARPMLKPSGSRVTHFTEDEDDPPLMLSYSSQQDSRNSGEEEGEEEDSEAGWYIPTQASLFGRGTRKHAILARATRLVASVESAQVPGRWVLVVPEIAGLVPSLRLANISKQDARYSPAPGLSVLVRYQSGTATRLHPRLPPYILLFLDLVQVRPALLRTRTVSEARTIVAAAVCMSTAIYRDSDDVSSFSNSYWPGSQFPTFSFKIERPHLDAFTAEYPPDPTARQARCLPPRLSPIPVTRPRGAGSGHTSLFRPNAAYHLPRVCVCVAAYSFTPRLENARWVGLMARTDLITAGQPPCCAAHGFYTLLRAPLALLRVDFHALPTRIRPVMALPRTDFPSRVNAFAPEMSLPFHDPFAGALAVPQTDPTNHLAPCISFATASFDTETFGSIYFVHDPVIRHESDTLGAREAFARAPMYGLPRVMLRAPTRTGPTQFLPTPSRSAVSTFTSCRTRLRELLRFLGRRPRHVWRIGVRDDLAARRPVHRRSCRCAHRLYGIFGRIYSMPRSVTRVGWDTLGVCGGELLAPHILPARRRAPYRLFSLYAARDALDAKLAALEDFVADARARLFDARSTVVNELRALRLSALPREVFSIIFIFTLDGDARPSRLKAPLVFLEVCRLWRDVALSTPQLWAELFWTLSKKNGKEQNNLADWVARAGGLGRRLTVAPSVPSLPRSEVAVSKRLFDALVNFPISDLHFASELSATVQSRIFKACTSSFSTLQRLSIRGTPLLVSEINLCFQSLSKLTLTSDWDSTRLPLDLKVEQAPFTTLTFLEIQPAISYTTFGRIILHCTALGNLALSVQTTEDVIVRPRELLHVRLVQLRLCLEEHGNRDLDQQAADDQRDFLKCLRFPSLRSISLQLIDGELTSSWEDGICEGIFSHCPNLDSLSWDMEKYDNRADDGGCPTGYFFDAIGLLPNLTNLSLVFEHRLALMRLFKSLDDHDSHGLGILPRLQVLRIQLNEAGEREMRTHLDDSAPFSWNRIVKFLTRRKETMRVLELRLAECGGKLHSATMPSEVQDLIGCGMLQLVVEYEDLDAEYSDLESEYHG
uniref:F-box domain-containing protein n=1 Tax=Mycena chlorophos TaxID=658473 RepID=A0ABQ0LT59_MYCCL|nr:predicted protein [Mycena chlorophos]